METIYHKARSAAREMQPGPPRPPCELSLEPLAAAAAAVQPIAMVSASTDPRRASAVNVGNSCAISASAVVMVAALPSLFHRRADAHTYPTAARDAPFYLALVKLAERVASAQNVDAAVLGALLRASSCLGPEYGADPAGKLCAAEYLQRALTLLRFELNVAPLLALVPDRSEGTPLPVTLRLANLLAAAALEALPRTAPPVGDVDFPALTTILSLKLPQALPRRGGATATLHPGGAAVDLTLADVSAASSAVDAAASEAQSAAAVHFILRAMFSRTSADFSHSDLDQAQYKLSAGQFLLLGALRASIVQPASPSLAVLMSQWPELSQEHRHVRAGAGGWLATQSSNATASGEGVGSSCASSLASVALQPDLLQPRPWEILTQSASPIVRDSVARDILTVLLPESPSVGLGKEVALADLVSSTLSRTDSKVSRWSEVLFLQLARVSAGTGRSGATRRSDVVGIPEELDLSASPASKGCGSPFYRLAGAIFHSGETPHDGHNTALGCVPPGPEWRYFDDWEELRIAEIRGFLRSDEVKRNTYVLVFRQVTNTAPRFVSAAAPALVFSAAGGAAAAAKSGSAAPPPFRFPTLPHLSMATLATNKHATGATHRHAKQMFGARAAAPKDGAGSVDVAAVALADDDAHAGRAALHSPYGGGDETGVPVGCFPEALRAMLILPGLVKSDWRHAPLNARPDSSCGAPLCARALNEIAAQLVWRAGERLNLLDQQYRFPALAFLGDLETTDLVRGLDAVLLSADVRGIDANGSRAVVCAALAVIVRLDEDSLHRSLVAGDAAGLISAAALQGDEAVAFAKVVRDVIAGRREALLQVDAGAGPAALELAAHGPAARSVDGGAGALQPPPTIFVAEVSALLSDGAAALERPNEESAQLGMSVAALSVPAVMRSAGVKEGPAGVSAEWLKGQSDLDFVDFRPLWCHAAELVARRLVERLGAVSCAWAADVLSCGSQLSSTRHVAPFLSAIHCVCSSPAALREIDDHVGMALEGSQFETAALLLGLAVVQAACASGTSNPLEQLAVGERQLPTSNVYLRWIIADLRKAVLGDAIESVATDLPTAPRDLVADTGLLSVPCVGDDVIPRHSAVEGRRTAGADSGAAASALVEDSEGNPPSCRCSALAIVAILAARLPFIVDDALASARASSPTASLICDFARQISTRGGLDETLTATLDALGQRCGPAYARRCASTYRGELLEVARFDVEVAGPLLALVPELLAKRQPVTLRLIELLAIAALDSLSLPQPRGVEGIGCLPALSLLLLSPEYAAQRPSPAAVPRKTAGKKRIRADAAEPSPPAITSARAVQGDALCLILRALVSAALSGATGDFGAFLRRPDIATALCALSLGQRRIVAALESSFGFRFSADTPGLVPVAAPAAYAVHRGALHGVLMAPAAKVVGSLRLCPGAILLVVVDNTLDCDGLGDGLLRVVRVSAIKQATDSLGGEMVIEASVLPVGLHQQEECTLTLQHRVRVAIFPTSADIFVQADGASDSTASTTHPSLEQRMATFSAAGLVPDAGAPAAHSRALVDSHEALTEKAAIERWYLQPRVLESIAWTALTELTLVLNPTRAIGGTSAAYAPPDTGRSNAGTLQRAAAVAQEAANVAFCSGQLVSYVREHASVPDQWPGVSLSDRPAIAVMLLLAWREGAFEGCSAAALDCLRTYAGKRGCELVSPSSWMMTQLARAVRNAPVLRWALWTPALTPAATVPAAPLSGLGPLVVAPDALTFCDALDRAFGTASSDHLVPGLPGDASSDAVGCSRGPLPAMSEVVTLNLLAPGPSSAGVLEPGAAAAPLPASLARGSHPVGPCPALDGLGGSPVPQCSDFDFEGFSPASLHSLAPVVSATASSVSASGRRPVVAALPTNGTGVPLAPGLGMVGGVPYRLRVGNRAYAPSGQIPPAKALAQLHFIPAAGSATGCAQTLGLRDLIGRNYSPGAAGGVLLGAAPVSNAAAQWPITLRVVLRRDDPAALTAGSWCTDPIDAPLHLCFASPLPVANYVLVCVILAANGAAYAEGRVEALAAGVNHYDAWHRFSGGRKSRVADIAALLGSAEVQSSSCMLIFNRVM